MPALKRDPVPETIRRAGHLVPLRTTTKPTTDSIETEDMLSLPEPEPERRGFERHDVWEAAIHVHILPENSSVAERGRVRNMSLNGMWVDTAHALPFKATVWTEWCIEGGLSKRFSGRVVRSTPAGMAVQLETDDPTWRFRSRFVELATGPNGPPLSMTVQADRYVDLEAAQVGPRADELAGLYRQWQQIEKDLGNEDLHQAFIHACLQARRLEYALERYRELQMLRPSLPSIERHIRQIGTILSFCTFQPDGTADRAPPWWKKPVLAAVAIVVLATGMTFVVQRFATLEHQRAMSDKEVQTLEPMETSAREPPPETASPGRAPDGAERLSSGPVRSPPLR